MWPKLYTKLSKDSTCVTWLELFFTYVEIFAVIKEENELQASIAIFYYAQITMETIVCILRIIYYGR